MSDERLVTELSDVELFDKFATLDRQRDAAKAIFENYKEVVAEMHRRRGSNFHWQDAEGTVFQLAISDGRWVTFEPLAVNRTRRNGEAKGTLSEKAAKELGYDIKK